MMGIVPAPNKALQPTRDSMLLKYLFGSAWMLIAPR